MVVVVVVVAANFPWIPVVSEEIVSKVKKETKKKKKKNLPRLETCLTCLEPFILLSFGPETVWWYSK